MATILHYSAEMLLKRLARCARRICELREEIEEDRQALVSLKKKLPHKDDELCGMSNRFTAFHEEQALGSALAHELAGHFVPWSDGHPADVPDGNEEPPR